MYLIDFIGLHTHVTHQSTIPASFGSSAHFPSALRFFGSDRMPFPAGRSF